MSLHACIIGLVCAYATDFTYIHTHTHTYIHIHMQGGFLGNTIARTLWESVSFSSDGVLWFGILPTFWIFRNWSNSESISLSNFFKDRDVMLAGAGLFCDVLVIVALKMMFRRQRPPFREFFYYVCVCVCVFVCVSLYVCVCVCVCVFLRCSRHCCVDNDV